VRSTEPACAGFGEGEKMRLLVKCADCGHIMNFHPGTEDPPRKCEKCGGTHLLDEGTA